MKEEREQALSGRKVLQTKGTTSAKACPEAGTYLAHLASLAREPMGLEPGEQCTVTDEAWGRGAR